MTTKVGKNNGAADGTPRPSPLGIGGFSPSDFFRVMSKADR